MNLYEHPIWTTREIAEAVCARLVKQTGDADFQVILEPYLDGGGNTHHFGPRACVVLRDKTSTYGYPNDEVLAAERELHQSHIGSDQNRPSNIK